MLRAPNWVGDLVMATPMLEAARIDPRFAKVSIGVRKHLAPLLADGPLEPHVVPLGGGREEIAQLKALQIDATLLFSNSPGAAWRALRAGIKTRAGAALGLRRHFLTHRVVPPTRGGRRWPIPSAHLMRDLAGLFGILVESLHPQLARNAEQDQFERGQLEQLGLGAHEPYVLCAPGAAFGAAKLWPPARFAEVLRALHERHGLRSVVSGGPGEEPLMDAVAGQVPGGISLAKAKRSLGGLKSLVAGSELLLVGDSGPRWVAAAFDVPCVSVMGPNFPELTASSLEWCEVIRRDDLECAPCLQRQCPLEHHRCLADLETEPVLAAAERLLARRAEVVQESRAEA